MSEEAEFKFGIWYPYKVFYMESMLTITRAAMAQQSSIGKIIKNRFFGSVEQDEIVIDLIQNFLQNCAAISRYFWPSGMMKKAQLKLALSRADVLRKAFEVDDTSPLNNRTARNLIEHFDEKLDSLFSQPIAGTFSPQYVGNRPEDAPQFFFRAYFVDEQVFRVLDVEVNIAPMVSEINRIHLLLEQFVTDNGRLPRA